MTVRTRRPPSLDPWLEAEHRASPRAQEAVDSAATSALARDASRGIPPAHDIGRGQVAALQRLAGNGALAGLLAPGPTLVQRDVDSFLRSTAAGKATSGDIGTTSGQRPITAHFFPGASQEKALVIGGVHGSEVSGIAVAQELVKRLSSPTALQPYFSVIVVPVLFPDNLAARRAFEAKLKGPLSPTDYAKAAEKADDPGRKTPGQEDPNRQMPLPGKDFEPKNPKDAAGRLIEAENQALLTLIQKFQPSRIASVHAIKNPDRAGVYADPHPDVTGADPKLASRTDLLARMMADRVKDRGGRVPGNKLGTKDETSLYPGQDPKESPDQIERENKKGTSLGQWGPPRGISVITIEMPEQYDASSPVKDKSRAKEIDTRAEALEEIFLGPTPEAMVQKLMERLQGARDAIGGFLGFGGTASPP